MKSATLLFAVFALMICGARVASAAEFGTAAEAEALLSRAAVALKADPAAAIAAFNKADGGFRDRDLYVFSVNASDGITTAHVNPAIVGKDVRTFKDPTGKAFGAEIFAMAKEGEVTEVSYMFPRPGSDVPVAKVSLVTRVGDQICGVGFYK